MLTLAPGTKLTMSKLPAVGGNGGNLFDSGCNPSRVKKVRIECGYFLFHKTEYVSTIKRLWFEFDHRQTDLAKGDVFYNGCPKNTDGNKMATFELYPNDEIVKIVVWSDNKLAHAVQFHTEMGIVSPMYGIPLPNSTATEFQGEDGSRLAGVHGRFGAAMDKLGFSFVTLSHAVPNAVCVAAWPSDTTSDQVSASVVRMNDVDKN